MDEDTEFNAIFEEARKHLAYQDETIEILTKELEIAKKALVFLAQVWGPVALNWETAFCPYRDDDGEPPDVDSGRCYGLGGYRNNGVMRCDLCRVEWAYEKAQESKP